MNTWTFTPSSDPLKTESVPYLEDARADIAPYYGSTKSIPRVKQEVAANLGLLNALLLDFREGEFCINGQTRKGYEVVFNWLGHVGVMRVAGLPMKRPTPNKQEQAMVQALLNLNDWLKTSITQKIFSPGETPLLPYLLVDGTRTLAEVLAEGKSLPLLGGGS